MSKTQCQEILAHLKRGDSLNPMQALNMYGCFRLASRINDLKNQGHSIDGIMIKRGKKSYKSYCLNFKPEQRNLF